jgi:DNA-binding CsgD family transcriptional regulator
VLAELLGDCVVIDRLTPELDRMHPLGAHHPDPALRPVLDEIRGIPFRADHGFTACVLERCAPLLLPVVFAEELHALQPEIAPFCQTLAVTGFLIAPLAAGGCCAGFVWQFRSDAQRPLNEDDMHFLHETAIRLALGVGSRELEEAPRREGQDPGGAPAPVDLHRLLTPREHAVLERIGDGDDDGAIADRLQLSPRTVEWYRQRIRRRRGVRDDAGIGAAARKLRAKRQG